MTNKLALSAFVLALIAILVVFVRSAETDKSTLPPMPPETAFQRVMRTQTIRCGYAIWNPVLFKDPKTNELKGIAHDVMEDIGKKLNLRVDWTEETGWGTLVEGLATGRYDMICNALGVVPGRARVIDFSLPLFYVPSYIVVRQDERRVAHNADMNNANYSFAILDGEAASFMVKEMFPAARINYLPQNADFTQVFQDVETGKADATIITSPDFDEYQKANPAKLKILDHDPIGVYATSFGLPQGDVALKSMIDATLGDVFADGQVDRIIAKYSFASDEFLPVARPYEMPVFTDMKQPSP